MKTQVSKIEVYPWHSDHWENFLNSRRYNRLSHAILLSGPSGLGKISFANRMSCALVCDASDIKQQPCLQCEQCRLCDNFSHPDIFWLQPEVDEKVIRVDAIRKLINKTTLKPQKNGRRIFVINSMDQLNKSGLNALLKTLEEPTSSCIFFLISSKPHVLPLTILSRCQKYNFSYVNDSIAEPWMRNQLTNLESDIDTENLLSLSGGAPLKAIKPDNLERLRVSKELIKTFVLLKKRKINPIEALRPYAKMEIEQLLEDMMRIISDFIRLKNTENPLRLFFYSSKDELLALCCDIDIQGLFNYLDSLCLLKKQINFNLNTEMILEKIFIDWLNLTRFVKT